MKTVGSTIGKAVALLAALSLASAMAAGGTPAGTQISNTATATFNDASGTAVTGTVTPTNPTGAPAVSNTVTTTINSVPVYSITPDDSAADPGPHPATPGQSLTNVVPGQTVNFPYTVTNSGNTPVQVALTTIYSLNGNVSTGSGIDPTTVKYYVDSNGDGILQPAEVSAGAVTSVTVPNNAAGNSTVKIIQQYVVPATSTSGSKVGADPVGTGTYPSAGATSTTYDTTVPVAGSSGAYLNQDANNFNQVTLVTPALTNNPYDSAPGTAGIQPPGTVTVPGNATPVPGYNAPTDTASPGTTPINEDVAGNNQLAYPPADTNNTPDVVRFTNTVINSSALSDTVNLFPTDATGAPIGTNTGGVFSGIPGLPTGTTVQFLDTAGNPLPLVNGYPTLTVPAGGQANYVTKVTYPDSDAAALPVIPVLVGVDSGNDAGVVADATSKDTIYPPFMQFGDATAALGTDPTPAPNVNVFPGTPATGQTDTATDNRAVFPMDVVNTGTYPEAYTLVGSVTVPLTTGANSILPVSYYQDVNSNGVLDAGDTLLSGGVTPSVATGTELKVLAVVDVPANMLSDNTPRALTQTATGNTSGVVRQDTNDTITAKISGTLGLKKFADNCTTTPTACAANHPYTDTPTAASTAAPADSLRYELVGQNNTNAAVQSVTLTDDFTTNNKSNLTLVSLSATTTVTTAKVLYRIGTSGAWTAISGTTALPANTSNVVLQFWYDGNGNGAADTGTTDALAAGSPNGAGFTININTQVK